MNEASEDASSILDTSKLEMHYDKKQDQDTTQNAVIVKNDEFDKDAIIVLKSDTAWNGLLVWDVLQSVGLRWGDGDLFHWENVNRNYGDDQLFSVWTMTDPGYFLPEEIKKGTMNPDNLVFGFSIPRSIDPEHISPIMLNVVKYCKKRLGGKILDENGGQFNEEQYKHNLQKLVQKMKEMGNIPGSQPMLMAY